MEHFTITFSIVMIVIGTFLALFYGVYMKRRAVGSGMGTPEKRIAVYGAIGIGVMFIGVGTIFLVLLMYTR